jgi:hypothetical protein
MTRSFGFLGFDAAGRFAVLCSVEVVRVPLEALWSAAERRWVDEGRSVEVGADGEGTAALGRVAEFWWSGEVVGSGWVALARSWVGAGDGDAFVVGEGGVRAAAGLGESSLPIMAQAVVEAAAAMATPAVMAAQRRWLGESLRVCGDGLRECWPKVNHGPG